MPLTLVKYAPAPRPSDRFIRYAKRDAVSGATQDHDPDTGQFTGGGGGGGGAVEPTPSAPDKADLHPKAIAVGGDQWNKDTAVRLESEYVIARPALDQIAANAVGEDVERPEDEDDAYVPDEWDAMSSADQEAALEAYKKSSYDDYYQSEVDNWQSEQAPDEARYKVASDFADGSETAWADNALAEYREERADEGLPDIPYSDAQLIDALKVEHDTGNYPIEKGTKIEIDDAKLEPDFAKNQMVLPGIDPAHVAKSALTTEMRIGLTKTIEDALDSEADDVKDKLDPPEYIGDSIAEYQEQSWDSMGSDDKFSWVKNNTSIIDEESAPPSDEIDKLPDRFDPLQDHRGSSADYRRTQLLANKISVDRALQIMKARNIGAERHDVQRIDNKLWSGWKSSSTSMEGKVLQVAAADELRGRLSEHREISHIAAVTYADKNYASIGGFNGLKAYIRAKWETTQYLLDKADIHTLTLYRGISLDAAKTLPTWQAVEMTPEAQAKHDGAQYKVDKYIGAGKLSEPIYAKTKEDADKIVAEKNAAEPKGPSIEKVEVKDRGSAYIKLPDIAVARNGAASTTTDINVANGWGSEDNRVVLRAEVPRTAVLSVPAYGINVQKEHEVVVTGTAWVGWDAWKGRAPSIDHVPMTHHGVAA